ncbi:MAG TPA: RNA-binding protein [Rhizomicrobium sp.]
MNPALAIRDEDDARRDRMASGGSRARERRCIVSGEVVPEDRLVRFVVSPDGAVTPDIAAVLPGRGIWVGAGKASVDAAVKKNLFAKAAKAQVTAAPGLAGLVERLLVRRMQADLGMARRSGQILLGFDQVQRALQSDAPPALVIEASDGAADGKRKLFAACHARGLKIETVECLDAAELGLALGRENVIHAALKSGRLQERLSFDAKRLSGFRGRPAASDERDV